jgi:hypothetical protein
MSTVNSAAVGAPSASYSVSTISASPPSSMNRISPDQPFSPARSYPKRDEAIRGASFRDGA